MSRPIVREIKWRWQQLMDERDRIWLNGHQSCYFNRLMDLGDPVEDKDAATKKYVDDAIALGGGIAGVPGDIPVIAPGGTGLVDGGFGAAAFDPAGEAAAEVGAHELTFDHTLLHNSDILDGDVVNNAAKNPNDVLTWNAGAGEWQPMPAPGAGGGDVVGPNSAIDLRIAVFDGPTGKLIKVGTKTIADLQDAAALTSGTLDGDRLPALSSSKKGGAPATGTPSGKFLKDDDTWDHDDHANLANKGTNTHTQIDTFIASKAAASGLASLDANSLCAQNPKLHASRHASSGADALKLDDCAAPDDNTDLNVSTAKHGLCPRLPNDAIKFLNGVGAYAVPGGSGKPYVVVGPDAWCDYVTDGTADDVQFNAAIAALPATGGTIYLAPGTYVLAATIDETGHPGVQIIGTQASIIDATAISVGILIDTPGNGGFELRGFVLRRTTRSSNSIGIKIINTGDFRYNIIDHIWVYGFDKQIAFMGAGTWPDGAAVGEYTISNCQIGKWSDTGCSYGIYITRAIQVNIVQNNICSFTTAGIYGERMDSSVIKDNIIISGNNAFGGSDPEYGILLNPTESDQLLVDVEIAGNAIENTFTCAINVQGTKDMFQIFIHDNEINGYNHGIFINGSSSSGCRQIHIYHNDIHDWREGDGRPIWVINAYDVAIDHNTIDATGTEFAEGIRLSCPSTRGGFSVTGNVIHRGATTEIGGIVIEGAKASVTGNSFVGTGTLTTAINLLPASSYCAVIGNVGTMGAITNSGSNNVVPAGTNT